MIRWSVKRLDLWSLNCDLSFQLELSFVERNHRNTERLQQVLFVDTFGKQQSFRLLSKVVTCKQQTSVEKEAKNISRRMRKKHQWQSSQTDTILILWLKDIREGKLNCCKEVLIQSFFLPQAFVIYFVLSQHRYIVKEKMWLSINDVFPSYDVFHQQT